MEGTDEKLVASVFILGLLHGFVRREDVVRWADQRIAAMDRPPLWLIDLSLSQSQHVLDVISLLRPIAEGANPATICRAIYALLPDLSGCWFGDARLWARFIYRITRNCVYGEWRAEQVKAVDPAAETLVWTADSIADTFDLVLDGYCILNHQQAVEQLVSFIAEHRDEESLRALQPVVWSCDPPAEEAHERPKPGRNSIWKAIWNQWRTGRG